MVLKKRRITRGLLAGCLLLSLAVGGTALAREPEIMSNLGAITISCSIYPNQAGVAGVRTGISQSQVEEVLGAPRSVKYGRGTMEYSYPSRTLLLVHFSPEMPYLLMDIKTTNREDATVDGVRPGMAETVLNDVYGQADAVSLDSGRGQPEEPRPAGRNHLRIPCQQNHHPGLQGKAGSDPGDPRASGGVERGVKTAPIYVPLVPPDYHFDPEVLEAALKRLQEIYKKMPVR